MMALGVWRLLYFMFVVVLSFTIRGTTGYGSNVICIPLLALMLPIPIIVPAFAILGLLAAIAQAVLSWRHISWREISRTLPLMILGVAVGLLSFRQLVEIHVLGKALGVFVVLYAIFVLRPRLGALGTAARADGRRAVRRAVGAAACFLTGFVATLFGGGGSFYVIHLNESDLDKARLRATLSSFLLLTSLLRTAGYIGAGFVTSRVLSMMMLGLPPMVVGMGLGQVLHIKASREAVTGLIMAILLVSGLALVFR